MESVTVEFLTADIVHPEPHQVLFELYANRRLSGEVIAVTDDGEKPKSLLVVKVPGLAEPVIVPAASTCPKESVSQRLLAGSEPDDGELLILDRGTYQKACPGPEIMPS